MTTKISSSRNRNQSPKILAPLFSAPVPVPEVLPPGRNVALELLNAELENLFLILGGFGQHGFPTIIPALPLTDVNHVIFQPRPNPLMVVANSSPQFLQKQRASRIVAAKEQSKWHVPSSSMESLGDPKWEDVAA